MRLVIFASACWLLSGCDNALPHRAVWSLDPQGQGENLGRAACNAAGRIPYQDDDGDFIYCMRIHSQ